jgi:hypothetical protein
VKGVAAEENLLALVPAGVFQPVTGDKMREYSVAHNFYREFLEEVLGEERAEEPGSRLSYRYFYDNPEMMYLQHLIKLGQAKMVTTGIAVNLLNLKADICVLLWINSEEWIKRMESKVNLNIEWKNHEERVENSVDEERNTIPLRELEALRMDHSNTLAPSAAAIDLALKAAKRLGWYDS